MDSYHIPVFLKQSIDLLNIKPDGVYVDVTFGGGGHTREILSRLGENGKVIAFDQDEDAIKNVPDDPRVIFVPRNFKFLETALLGWGFEEVDGILADLGISSHQIDVPERGFSFRFDAPLDMRMNQEGKLTAAEVLNTYEAEDLIRVFSHYGEVQNTKRLVRVIIAARESEKIGYTQQLEGLIATCIPPSRKSKYLAQVYQALRIEVNKEMEVLSALLMSSLKMLKVGGIMSVIAYHSLEDRMVKRFFRAGKFDGQVEKDMYGNPLTPWKLITRKAIQPDAIEIEQNSRARSAKLRAAEKL